MEISDIKAHLKIETVLSHYGITLDKNNMICCPFHNDKTPSMQVYPKTNTVFCFSANCELNGKAIDQIDFILHKDKCTKHAALLKAKELLGNFTEPKQEKPSTSVALAKEITQPNNNGNDLARIAILTKLMGEALQSIRRSEKAKTYLDERGLQLETRSSSKVEIGYLMERFYHSWNEIQKQSAIDVGILIKRSNGMLSPVFKNCILLPIKNKDGHIINLYGRSILPDKQDTARHFYLKGSHRGIYPCYPNPNTTHLILTESIIDAKSLLQVKDLENYEVIALYGTNGLTAEIKTAIQELKKLEEITLFFDGDDAGRKAIEKYTKELHELIPTATISKVNTPENEDINSLLVSHEPEIFLHLIHEREIIFSVEKENSDQKETPTNQHHESKNLQSAICNLNTTNPEKLIYTTDELTITVWGGIEYGNLHRLKLSLHLENHGNDKSFRDDVNLYSHRGKKTFLQDAAEELAIPQTELKHCMEDFTREIEAYRMQEKERFKATLKPDVVTLNELEKVEAIKLLKSTHLIKELKGAMTKTGLIGETDNGLLLFLIFLTRYFDYPLHALVHGSSGSGKTNLLKTILKLVPEESKYSTTALTENVLFRPPYKDFWKNKVLLLEDLDGSYKALYPLREFMTNQSISKLASEPDPKTGQFKQVQLEANGPIVIAGATTKDRIYEDNSNRSFLIHVNESKAHQDEILHFQNKQAAGLIDFSGIEKTVQKIHNIQRLLNKQLYVVNPFQPQLKLPEYIFKKLRTNTHYITLIKSITFLNQYQRKHHTDERGNRFIQTTLEDIALANTLSKQSLLRKSDELSGEVRDFFESLKREVKKSSQTSFISKEIRERFRMHPMKFNRRINELKNRGYLKQSGGNRKTSYEYEITTWDDYQVLQKGLTIMDEILENLYKQYPDGIFTPEKS